MNAHPNLVVLKTEHEEDYVAAEFRQTVILPWFRYYSATLTDHRIQSLSDRDFRYWANLLCLVCAYDGRLPDIEHIAFTLRISTTKAHQVIARFRKQKILKHDEHRHLMIGDWQERRYGSDSSTPRVRRHREKQQAEQTDDPKALEGFEEFWTAYPKRDGSMPKHGASEVYRKIMLGDPRPDPKDIIAGAKRFAEEMRDKETDGTRYVPSPDKWLERKRWTDEPARKRIKWASV